MPPFRSFLVAATFSLGAAGLARAQPPAPAPQGVVNLSASASTEVAHDLMSVVLAARRDGADAGAVQQQLGQALDAALVEARKAARPGRLDVRTGAFAVGVRYGDKGLPAGWQGTAELVLEGRDLAAIAQLAGRLPTMIVARVGYDLSRELRAKAEGEVTAQAVALFQARAAEAARLFGYAGYALREVTVGAADVPGFRPMAMKALAAPAGDAPLPVEAGRGTITVNVNGAVQLTR